MDGLPWACNIHGASLFLCMDGRWYRGKFLPVSTSDTHPLDHRIGFGQCSGASMSAHCVGNTHYTWTYLHLRSHSSAKSQLDGNSTGVATESIDSLYIALPKPWGSAPRAAPGRPEILIQCQTCNPNTSTLHSCVVHVGRAFHSSQPLFCAKTPDSAWFCSCARLDACVCSSSQSSFCLLLKPPVPFAACLCLCSFRRPYHLLFRLCRPRRVHECWPLPRRPHRQQGCRLCRPW